MNYYKLFDGAQECSALSSFSESCLSLWWRVKITLSKLILQIFLLMSWSIKERRVTFDSWSTRLYALKMKAMFAIMRWLYASCRAATSIISQPLTAVQFSVVKTNSSLESIIFKFRINILNIRCSSCRRKKAIKCVWKSNVFSGRSGTGFATDFVRRSLNNASVTCMLPYSENRIKIKFTVQLKIRKSVQVAREKRCAKTRFWKMKPMIWGSFEARDDNAGKSKHFTMKGFFLLPVRVIEQHRKCQCKCCRLAIFLRTWI